MTYCSSAEIFNYLGKNAKTKVRSEIVGTSSTTASTTWELDFDNVISSSLTLYTGSTAVSTASYTSDLDDGTVTLSGVASGSVLSADYDYSDIPDSMVQQMISSSDSLIDTETGRTFGTASTIEYMDVDYNQDTFFLKYYPITALTRVERNISAPTEAEDWEECTIGIGNDFIANSDDLAIGRLRFIDDFPYPGLDYLRATYTYGYSSTPLLVQELSILLTVRQMVDSTIYKSIVTGQDNYSPARLNEINDRIEELKRILKKQNTELI